MSKINQIENAILQLEGGKFQKLVDQYLYLKYKFTNIQPLGAQQGTDKTTKGVPDSYVRTTDGKYIAIMYGTYSKETAKFNKVKSDILSCLERIDNKDLSEIICCHTSSNFTIEQNKEIHSLYDHITLIGINTLANDLFYHYPNLAKEYLSVEIDTKQILTPEDFIIDNNKSVFRTPLDVDLVGRDDEFSELVQTIKNNDVIIVEGPSGVGKTKLAYECCRYYCDKHNCKFYIVKNRNLSIYDDLRAYFSDNDKYLILVDDANKLTDLELVLELLKDANEDRSFKIILTVRDYAKKDTISKIKDFVIPYEYKLKPLDKDTITKIITDNLEIKNQAFLKQISEISKGNVRLAFMAGINAKQEGYYANIQNSSEIFSSYFKYIFKDLNNKELIVMAITAFIESFEIQNNESLVYKLANVIGISNDFVVETCEKFHNLEIVDVYENLAVKFSDQNLCDYIIYHIFFENKDIELEKLISLVFPYAPEKVTYHLNTTLQLFYSDDMLVYLKASVKHIWSTNTLDKGLAYKYAECFHSLIEDEVLLFIKTEISNIQLNKTDILHYQFNKNNSSHNDNILKILTGYKYSSNLDSSIELFVQYVNKNSSNPENIKVHLINGYGIDKKSHESNYTIEYNVLNLLNKKFKETQSDATAVLCMLYASSCLKYLFKATETSYKSKAFNIISFSLANGEGIKRLHNLAIETLCDFYSKFDYKEFAYKQFLDYYPNTYEDNNLISVIKNDSMQLELKLSKIIDISNIKDCNILYHFNECFKANNVNVSSFFSLWETNKQFKLIKKLQKTYYSDKDSLIERPEEFDQKILIELKQEIYSMKISEIEELLSNTSKLKFDNEWYLYKRWSQIVCDCDEEKLYSYVDLTIKYTSDNYFAHDIIERMIITYGYDKTSSIINSYNIEKIANWYRELISFIPEDKIDLDFCNQVLTGLCENNILYRLSFETVSRINRKQPFFMQKYIDEIINIYDSKKESHQLISNFLNHGNIFDENNINDFLKSFKSNNQLIKIYVYASKEEINFDYQNILFNAILKNDKSIINAIIDLYLDGDSNHKNLNHLKTIWDYDNYLYLFEYTVNYITGHNTYDFIIMNCLKDVMETLYSQQEKLMESILYLIDKNKSNDKLVKYIIQASDVLSKEHRYELTLHICKMNKSIEVFKICPIGIYPKHGWSGSTVPVLENKLKEFEEIAPKLQGVDYIEHRIYCNECIECLRKQIKETISKEFMYDY